MQGNEESVPRLSEDFDREPLAVRTAAVFGGAIAKVLPTGISGRTDIEGLNGKIMQACLLTEGAGILIAATGNLPGGAFVYGTSRLVSAVSEASYLQRQRKTEPE